MEKINFEFQDHTGIVLLQRYILTKKFNSCGAHSHIYLAKDQERDQQVLVKVTEDQEMNFKEHSILKALKGDKAFPNIYGGGTFEVHGMQKQCFIVLEKLGQNLEQILDTRNKCFSLQTICQLGIILLDNIKKVHQIGCIHNDLKLENILVETDVNSEWPIKLIDFGLSTSYLEPDGSHIKRTECSFSGNPIFCSVHSLLQMSQSRRDDIISIAYILLYLHQGKLWFFQNNPELETLEYIAFKKQLATPLEVCGSFSQIFLPFVEYTYSLQFTDEPDYERLKIILRICLSDNGLELSNIFDWTEQLAPKMYRQTESNHQTCGPREDDEVQGDQNYDVDIIDECHKNIQKKLNELQGQTEFSEKAGNQNLFDLIIQKQNSWMQESSQGQFEGGKKSDQASSLQQILRERGQKEEAVDELSFCMGLLNIKNNSVDDQPEQNLAIKVLKKLKTEQK